MYYTLFNWIIITDNGANYVPQQNRNEFCTSFTNNKRLSHSNISSWLSAMIFKNVITMSREQAHNIELNISITTHPSLPTQLKL